MNEYICPHCKNVIRDEDAVLCHFCGESLQRSGEGILGRLKYAKMKILWIVISIFILLCFVLFFLR